MSKRWGEKRRERDRREGEGGERGDERKKMQCLWGQIRFGNNWRTTQQ